MRRLPRRALLGATLGAAYALLILPGPWLGVYPPAIGWFALSAGLLLVNVWAYHAFTLWATLWVVYRAILLGRAGDWMALAFDLPLPLASLYLLMTSGYRETAMPPEPEAAEA
ncbi:MAG TPA: hypothetical protein VNX21_03840 [Candidatus Thermoplasmatota archaeon]|nr:hypothetical protein [Candidatus Thermoplasmatota archaeon]